MTRGELIKVIKRHPYCYFGIRSLTEDEDGKYEIGDFCRNSYGWDLEYDVSTYDTETPVLLNGTCAVNTKIVACWDEDDEISEKLDRAIEKSDRYIGDIVLIAGDRMEYGEDDDEIIVENAVVLAVKDDLLL